jgi:hypothetical protein
MPKRKAIGNSNIHGTEIGIGSLTYSLKDETSSASVRSRGWGAHDHNELELLLPAQLHKGQQQQSQIS